MGRARLAHRAYVVTRSREHLAAQLEAFADGAPHEVVSARARTHAAPRIAFLFTGQGSQYPGMGGVMYETQPAFRAAFDACATIADPLLGTSLRALLDGAAVSGDLDRTRFTQPALFALEYALTEMWRSWGIEPEAVIGHSIGEYAAACAAGVFGLEDGLRLVIERGRLIDELPEGAMAIVHASEPVVCALLDDLGGDVCVAAVNGPAATTISGPTAAISEALTRCAEHDLAANRLRVSHAFHSGMMDPALDAFERAAARIVPAAPRVALISNLTGSALQAGYVPTARYWREHVRMPVRFGAGIAALLALGIDALVEIGPNPVLIALSQVASGHPPARWLPSLRKGADDLATALGSLGELALAGAAVDWQGFDRGYSRRLLSLPTYPFERSRSEYARDLVTEQSTGEPTSPLLGGRVRAAAYSRETRLNTQEPQFLADHRLEGTPALPASAYVEIALGVGHDVFGGAPFSVRELDLHSILPLPDDERLVVVQMLGTEHSIAGHELRILSTPSASAIGDPWTLNARCRLQLERPEQLSTAQDRERLRAVRERCLTTMTARKLYASFSERGLEYGPAFRGVRRLWRRDLEALGRVSAPDSIASELHQYTVHPAVLDAAFQVLAAALPSPTSGDARYLPVRIERVRVLRPLTRRLWSHAVLGLSAKELSTLVGRKVDPTELLPAEIDELPELLQGDVDLLDDRGRVAVEVKGLRLKRVAAASPTAGPDRWLYSLQWEPNPVPGAAPPSPAQAQLTAAPTPSIAQAPSRAATSWLLIAPAKRHAAPLQRALRAQGCETSVALARRGDEIGEVLELALMRHTDAGLPGPEAVAFVPGRARPVEQVDGWHDIAPHYATALELVKALARASPSSRARLWIVTRAATPAAGDGELVDPRHAPLWGLGAVAAFEHPELHPSLLDLPAAPTRADLAAAAGELVANDVEDRLAVRGGRISRQRLVHRADGAEDGAGGDILDVPDADDVVLESQQAGRLDRLALVPYRRRPAILREVELEVRAAGLNFRDVMKALGLYPTAPGEPTWLGDECSGVVSNVGPEVTDLAVGDEVVGFVPRAFSTHASTLDTFLVRKPAHLTWAQAATIPVAYATALYAFTQLARLAPGERVLIHAAAGGVGMAAVRVAHALGAEVFATAGSEPKRELVRAMGVAHVMDSRSLAFADQVMALTDGEGVHVALNSIAGDAIQRTLGVLAVGGRFVEIGKVDIYQNASLGLAPFRRNLAFFAVDLDEAFRHRPPLAQQLLEQAVTMIESEQLGPLPATPFPLTEAPAAFRWMAQARHAGKIVLTPNRPREPTAGALDPGAAYLITGGLGTLGRRTARVLYEASARHLVLAGRRGPSPEATVEIDALRTAGAEVTVRQVDVTQGDAVGRLVGDLEREIGPLRGVFHLAAAVDDGLLADQSAERAAAVLGAKALGAWHLHHHTRSCHLEHFVMFSSIAAFIGAPGQGPYAAANAFLDALAHHRRFHSLAATSIDWGYWAGGGLGAGVYSEKQLREIGVGVIPADTGARILFRLLADPAAQVAVVPAQWEKLATNVSSIAHRPLFAGLTADRDTERLVAARAEVLGIAPAQRPAYIEKLIVRELAQVMQLEGDEIEGDEIDVDKPLNQLGVDSLMGLELKERWESQLEIELPLSVLVDSPTISELSHRLTRLLDDPDFATKPPAELTGEGAREQMKEALSRVGNASDDEIDTFLQQRAAGRAPASVRGVESVRLPTVSLGWLERATDHEVAARLRAIAGTPTADQRMTDAQERSAGVASVS